jgi:hypothetical protein
VIVQILDAKGNPVPGAPVTISALAGTVMDSLVRTDSSGRASIKWTMGRMAGPHALSVRLAGVERALRVTATASSAAPENLSIERVASTSKTAATRDVKFIATVSDVFGNPVSGARVSLVAQSGTVTPANAVSDSKGRVTGTWKLAAKSEEQTLRATVKGTQTKGALVATGPSPATAVPVSALAPKPAVAKPATTTRTTTTKKPVTKKPAPKPTAKRQ